MSLNAFPVRVGDDFEVQEHNGTHNVTLAKCYDHATAARIIAALRAEERQKGSATMKGSAPVSDTAKAPTMTELLHQLAPTIGEAIDSPHNACSFRAVCRLMKSRLAEIAAERDAARAALARAQQTYASACFRVVKMGVPAFGTLDEGLDKLAAKLPAAPEATASDRADSAAGGE